MLFLFDMPKKSTPDRSDDHEVLDQIAELRKENAELRDLLGQTVVLVQTVFVYLGTDPLSIHRCSAEHTNCGQTANAAATPENSRL